MAQQLIRDDVWALGVGHPLIPTQVIGVGAKGRQLGLSTASFPSVVEFQRQYDAARGRVRIGVHNFPPRELLGAVARATPRLVRERLGRA